MLSVLTKLPLVSLTAKLAPALLGEGGGERNGREVSKYTGKNPKLSKNQVTYHPMQNATLHTSHKGPGETRHRETDTSVCTVSVRGFAKYGHLQQLETLLFHYTLRKYDACHNNRTLSAVSNSSVHIYLWTSYM